MPLPLIRYPLDTTGVNPDNFVSGEIHALSDKPVRALATTYGAFFTESVRVYDNRTQQLLTRGTHYYCTELLQEASSLYGKEICFLVIITDATVSPEVSISYQVLGGNYTNTATAVVNLYQNILNDNRPINFVNIINRPDQYPSGPHMHPVDDIYGFEYLVTSLERLRQAIIIADVPAFESTMDWLATELDAIRAFYTTNLDVVSAHIANKGNPHENTKEQVGVGNVVNLPLASASDITYLLGLPPGADDRTIATDKYISLRTLLQFKNHFDTRLRALENP